MVIAEIALALPLVAAAGLMTHSFLRLSAVQPGFQAENLLTVQMLLLPVRDRALHAEFVSDALARVRRLPQVVAAGSIGRLPMDGGNSGSWYYPADRPEPVASERPRGDISVVSPDYFAAMRIPLMLGRDFASGDRIGSPHVAIINQTAARALFGGDNAVGRRLKVAWNDAREVEIVGVVADIRHGRLQASPEPCLFLPNAQQPFPFSALVIRTAGNPTAVASAVKAEIHALDPDQGIGRIESMETIIADTIAPSKIQTVLVGVFAALALTLASIGIYGVLACSVALRTREIGVRLALGASPLSACRFVAGQGCRLVAIGLTIGLGASGILTRFIRGLLFEVEPLDPAAFAAVTALVCLVAVAACAIPAARATRIDPAIVLRDE